MQLTNIELGKIGEDLACNYLGELGFEILDRNWRSARVELDIVANDHGTLVFCEVKTRRSSRYGHPSEAITQVKLAHLRTAALLWLGTHRTRFSGIRFDVISILYLDENSSQISHIKGLD